MNAGADAVAIISAILDAQDIETATRRIIERIEKKK
jgi:thiamine monophosphate synthase